MSVAHCFQTPSMSPNFPEQETLSILLNRLFASIMVSLRDLFLFRSLSFGGLAQSQGGGGFGGDQGGLSDTGAFGSTM